MPTVNTFAEARKLHNPPSPLLTYVEFETGAGRATLSGFERPWRSVATLGSASVTTVSAPLVEGSKAIKVTWDRANTLSIIATTLATGVNLSNLETVRLFIRSSATGFPMRLGLGESSGGEFLPEIAALATANVFLERNVVLTAVPQDSRNAIKKLRIELYGNGSAATITTFFDNYYAIKRSRYSNIFAVRPSVVVPDLEIDCDMSGVFGHLMNNTYPMDDTGLMGDGIIDSECEVSPDVDLSTYKSLSADITISAAPATVTFGFGESNAWQQTFPLRVVTAGQAVNKNMSLTSILAANRNEVQYFGITPTNTPTTGSFTVSADTLRAHYYDTPSPILPYRIFHEKLLNIQPIMHSVGPVQEASRISNTVLRLDNLDSEFYRLRDTAPSLNRRVDISVGFQNLPVAEDQSVMRGIVRNESIGDEAYEIEVQDVIDKLIVDLPPNVIQDRQYIFPSSLGAGSAVWREDQVPGWSRPHPQHHGRPIPLAFGHTFVPMLLIHRGFWKGTTSFSPIISAWKFLDDTFGASKEVVRIFRGNLAGEFHAYGTKLTAIASFNQFSAGFVANIASGIIYTSDGQTEAGGTGTGGFVIPHFAEIRGYADDSNGTWTGSASTAITNPSDVTRFMLMNVLKLDASEVNLTDLNSSRTSLTKYPMSRAIIQREAAFDLLGGRSSQGGLASNVFAYFFASNIDGKAKIVPASTSVVTAGTYRSTGQHANIIRGSYHVRSQPERIITRVEVDTGYNVASASDHSFVSVINHQAEAYAGVNRKEPLRIAGKWLPNDVKILSVRYVGTASLATMTILGEGEDTTQTFRLTCSNANQSFTVDLTGASGSTISKLKVTLANKSFLTATIGNAVSSALDARFLRAVNNISIATTASAPTLVGRIRFGYGKMLAWDYLDYYDHNRDAVSWRAPWIGFQQELTQYVRVRSLGESTARVVKILQTRKDPRTGVVDFTGETE